MHKFQLIKTTPDKTLDIKIIEPFILYYPI